MLRTDPFITGEYYHLYNRGIDKRVIFKSDHDFKRFMILLYIANSQDSFRLDNLIGNQNKTYDELFTIERGESLVSMGAWCLMTNHFHILIRQEVDGGITKFMRKLSTAYSMYFNKKYNRQGGLFGSKFKSKLIGVDDNYMRQMFGYIHLNPLDIEFSGWGEKDKLEKMNKIEMKKFLDSYLYSSYQDYLGVDRIEKSIINPTKFPDYFHSQKSFSDFVENYFMT